MKQLNGDFLEWATKAHTGTTADWSEAMRAYMKYASDLMATATPQTSVAGSVASQPSAAASSAAPAAAFTAGLGSSSAKPISATPADESVASDNVPPPVDHSFFLRRYVGGEWKDYGGGSLHVTAPAGKGHIRFRTETGVDALNGYLSTAKVRLHRDFLVVTQPQRRLSRLGKSVRVSFCKTSPPRLGKTAR